MRITHFTPGTGHFFCGSCLRDNTLVGALRRRGHDVTMVPLYLPFVVEDEAAAPTTDDRVFMGGLNMYLQQKLPLLRWLPAPVARRLDSPRLLRWLSSKSHMTDAAELGAMMVSTLRGESGRQAHEIDKLLAWMTTEPTPDVICLSNVMLIGLARRLKATLGAPLVCSLQGEAPFLDALPEPFRGEAWALIAERAADVDAFVPVSRYYAALMGERLGLGDGSLHVVRNGIDLDGIPTEPEASGDGPVIGYLARMCPEKGLHTLVEAFTILKRSGDFGALRLHVTGAMLAGDHSYVDDLRERLDRDGLGDHVRFMPNISRAEKLAFLRSTSILSVPATYGEAFGLYVVEALAAGIPVVQPRHGAFPELLEASGGGLLCEPDDAESLADGIRRLLEDESEARSLGERGRGYVREHCTADRMAVEFENVCMMVAGCPTNSR